MNLNYASPHKDETKVEKIKYSIYISIQSFYSVPWLQLLRFFRLYQALHAIIWVDF